MLEALLGYQLARQSGGAAKSRAPELAKRLAALAAGQPKDGLDWLRNFLSVAEFLARETRSGGAEPAPRPVAEQGAVA
jgi:CRISPR-associated protein Cmr2